MLFDESKNLLAIFDVMFLSDSLREILKFDFLGPLLMLCSNIVIFELWVVFLNSLRTLHGQASKLSLMQVATHQLTLLPLMQFLSLFQGNSLEAPAATAPSRHECELIPAANQLAALHDQADDKFDDYSVHQIPNFRLEPFIFDDRDSDRESTTMAPGRRSLWTDFDGATSSLR